MLPYTETVLLSAVQDYQAQWWWLAALFYPAIVLAVRRYDRVRWHWWVLAVGWGVCGGLFFARHFSGYDFVARYEAGLFLIQALALVVAALWPGSERAAVGRANRRIGGLLMAAGLVGLPLADALAQLAGASGQSWHWQALRWPGTTPWATVMVTFGVLLYRSGPWYLWPLPLLWTLKVALVAYWLAMPRDAALPVAAVLALGAALFTRWRNGRSG